MKSENEKIECKIGIPQTIYELLKERANQNNRSIEEELIEIIEEKINPPFDAELFDNGDYKN